MPSSVVHLDRMCTCGHSDSEHVVRYYQTGNRSPVCERRACGCQHFTTVHAARAS